MATNTIVLCPYCKEEIQPTAIKCKHCASDLTLESKSGSLWISITSMVLGIISILALLDDSAWDEDSILGLFIFAGSGLFLGILAVNQRINNKGMSIAGIVLSSIAVLSGIGLLIE